MLPYLSNTMLFVEIDKLQDSDWDNDITCTFPQLFVIVTVPESWSAKCFQVRLPIPEISSPASPEVDENSNIMGKSYSILQLSLEVSVKFCGLPVLSNKMSFVEIDKLQVPDWDNDITCTFPQLFVIVTVPESLIRRSVFRCGYRYGDVLTCLSWGWWKL